MRSWGGGADPSSGFIPVSCECYNRRIVERRTTLASEKLPLECWQEGRRLVGSAG